MKNCLFMMMLFFMVIVSFADEIAYGTIICDVKSDDKTSRPNEKVVVVVGDTTLDFITDVNGFILGKVPVGEATIKVGNNSRTTTILEGKESFVHINIIRPGVNVIISNPKGLVYYMTAAFYTLNDNKPIYISSRNYGESCFLLVPPEATSLTGYFYISSVDTNKFPRGVICRKWKFDTVESRRDVTAYMPMPIGITLKLIDENDKSIPNGVKVTGRIIWNAAKDLNDGCINKEETNKIINNFLRNPDPGYFNFTSTVMNNCITLPRAIPEISYILHMNLSNNIFCKPTEIVISDDGNINSLKCIKRNVIQTLYNSKGKIAVNTIVNASYNINGIIKFRCAKSDDKGIVYWDNLPALRVTIWGDDIPCGVIPSDASVITLPLLPPDERNLPVEIISSFGKLSGVYTVSYTVTNTVVNFKQQNKFYFSTNKLTTLYVKTDEVSLSIKVIKFYTPFNDYSGRFEDNQNTLEVNGFIQMYTAKIKIMNSDGLTPALVNRVKVITDEMPVEVQQSGTGVIDLTKNADGFILKSFIPGEYKLLIDSSYDADNYLTKITLPVKGDVIVKMPDSKTNLPSGSTVFWTDVYNPLDVHKMTLRLDGVDCPFYYDKNKIFAWWCKISPSVLMVYKKSSLQKLNLHTYTMKIAADTTDENIINDSFYLTDYHLLPLLPNISNNLYNIDATPGVVFKDTNDIFDNMQLINNQKTNLWSTKYLLQTKNNQKATTIMNISKDTPREILIKKPVYNESEIKKNIKVNFNLSSNGRQRVYATWITALFDDDIYHRQFINCVDGNHEISIPEKAGRITVYYPGFGMVKDIPLNIQNNIISLDGNNFQQMTRVKGRILGSDGNPMKKSWLYIKYADNVKKLYDFMFMANSDNNGNYSFENIPAGTYLVSLANPTTSTNCKDGAWIINVPDTKEYISNINVNGKPVVIQMNNLKKDVNAWWLEDETEKAKQLPSLSNFISSHDFSPVSGYLYTISVNDSGLINAFYNYVNCYSKNEIKIDGRKTAVLTLVANLNDNIVYPDVVKVTGIGPWQDIQMTLPLKWSFFTGFDSAMSQISCLAPGKWKLNFVDNTGKIIEQNITIGSTDIALEIKL